MYTAVEADEQAWGARLQALKNKGEKETVAACIRRYLDFLDHDDANVYELSAFGVKNKEAIKDAGGWGSKAKLIGYAKGRSEVVRLTEVGLEFGAEALYMVSGRCVAGVGLGYPTRGAWHIMEKHTTDEQVVERRVLPFDLDPKREPKDRSATADEHKLALKAGKFLTCFFWSLLDRLGRSRTCLAYGPSGNGFHCLIAVAIPETPEVPKLYTSILEAARRRVRTWIDKGVDVDLTLSNASRLLPIYGSKKCKGGEDPELKIRHRWSYLVADKPSERLSLDDLQALLALVLEGLPPEVVTSTTAVTPTPVARPRSSKRSNPERAAAWQTFRERIAAIPLVDIMRLEGLMDGDVPTCPGHGEPAKGSDIAIIPTRSGRAHLLNCQHSRCHGKGDCRNTKGTNWTGLGVVMERRKCDAKMAQDILAEAFHVEKPKGRPQKYAGKKLATEVLVAVSENPSVSHPNFEAVRRACERLELDEEEVVALAKILKAKKWQDRQVELLLGQGVLEQITPDVADLAELLDEKRQPLLTQLLCFAAPMIPSAPKELVERFKATAELVDRIPALSSDSACALLAYRIHSYAECNDEGELVFPFSADAVDPESLLAMANLSWPTISKNDEPVSTLVLVTLALMAWQKLHGLKAALEPMKAPNASHVMTGLIFMEANDRIKYDRFTQEATYIRDDLSWGTRAGDIIVDAHDVILQGEVQKFLGTPVGIESLRAGVKAFTRSYYYDSALDWLDSLPPWDGVERLVYFMSVCKMTIGPAQRTILYYWITQIVRRIQHAEVAAKADYMLVLVGEQGASKSTIFELMGLDKWTYTMHLADLRDRNKLSRKMQGKLVVNVDELAGGSAADRETVKAFISSVYEEFDVKWQRAIEKAARRFTFGGTTNWADILRDPTGDRRFLPVEVGKSDDKELEDMRREFPELWSLVIAEIRDQLAEGARYYPDRAEEDFIERYQEGLGFRYESAVDQRVERHLDVLRAHGVTAARVWEVWTLTRIPTERTIRDDFGREHEAPAFRSYDAFCRDAGLGHKISEAIKKALPDPQAKVRRRDGSREKHAILSRTLGAENCTLDETGDLAGDLAPKTKQRTSSESEDQPDWSRN
jgi:hypothetical protein